MQWKIPSPNPPKDGETRLSRRFAWTPTKVGRYMIWLERYEVEERFFAPSSGNPGWWSEVERRPLEWMY